MNAAPSNTPSGAARLLIAVRNGGAAVASGDIAPADVRQTYAVQDATLAQTGPIGGWKVGARGTVAEPNCAPLPASGLLPSGAALIGPAWQLRGIEVEVALRVGRNLGAQEYLLTPADLAAAFDAVLPVIEVVETRLADWREADALSKLADLQSHGALVLGKPSAMAPAEVDLRTVQAQLSFNGQPVASTCGANPVEDVWRVLAWLVRHCAERGQPLRKGQIVTTGSCTGMLFAPAGASVQAALEGIGAVSLEFRA